MKLTKATSQKFWHISEGSINETLCGMKIYSTWKDKTIASNVFPKNTCKECLSMVVEENVPAMPDKTHPHHSW